MDTIIRLTYGEEYGIHMESLTLNAETLRTDSEQKRKAKSTVRK